jgi:mannose-6-phosphate isomerase-like protein (cupin superfamily)
MQITKASDANKIKNPHGVNANKLYDTEHAQAIHLTIAPGEALKKHITPVDVFFYVLEGTGVVEVGTEKQTVSTDTLIESPARIPHCWYNESNAPLRILVVKTPKPTEPTKFC